MFAEMHTADIQALVVILGGMLAAVGAIWGLVRQIRSSFADSVRDILTVHHREVTQPEIDKIARKVDQIKVQVELNNGKSLKDVVVRTEAKVDLVEAAIAAATADRARVAQDLEQHDHPSPHEGAP
jgi:uncharacterized membrane protein